MHRHFYTMSCIVIDARRGAVCTIPCEWSLFCWSLKDYISLFILYILYNYTLDDFCVIKILVKANDRLDPTVSVWVLPKFFPHPHVILLYTNNPSFWKKCSCDRFPSVQRVVLVWKANIGKGKRKASVQWWEQFHCSLHILLNTAVSYQCIDYKYEGLLVL